MSNDNQLDGNTDIRVNNLNKFYSTESGEQKIFENLSFSIERESLVVFIGPSGCGESTLLRILLGAEEATYDELYVNNERFKRTAGIEQSPALFPWRTAFQNAHVGVEIQKSRLRREGKEYDDTAFNKNVCDDFKLFRLQGCENKYPHELSGGMQQRVAIIRALQSGPDLLFCDEPFSAVDFVTRLELNTEFKQKSKLMGCTTLFVTHNIEEAIFLADRILVFKGNPCTEFKEIRPQLGDYSENAVKCRLSPKFSDYFNEIWELLKYSNK